MARTLAAITMLGGMRALAGPYDLAILDLWGVIHDGLAPYPGALDCMARMRASGMKLVLLSNAPRRSKRVIHRISALGIRRGAYDAIVTSGDLTRRALAAREDAWHGGLGRAYYHLGPAHDWGIVSGLDYRAVDTLEDSDFILNTGLFDDDHENVGDYGEMLRAALARRLPMVCANPDLAVTRGVRRVPCAGALAEAYEAMGGPTAYHGKPHAAAYAACLARYPGIERRRVLAVGDSLHTDMAGAAAAGLDAVLVTGGIHADELGVAPGEVPEPRRLARLCAAAGVTPMAALRALAW